MSYEIIPFSQNKSIAPVRGQLSALSQKLKKGTDLKRISIRNGVFRLVVGGEEIAKNKQGYMDIVILNTTLETGRVYYEKAYDPTDEAAAPPRCYSEDGVAPHKSIENPKAKLCEKCPMNIAGSGQGNTKACRYAKRVAVALATDVDSGVYQLVLPSKSIFGKGDDKHMPFNQYIKWILSLNFNVESVVTRMSFDDDADSVKLVFSAVGHASSEMQERIDELVASPEAELAIQMPTYRVDNGKNPAATAKDEEEAPPPKAKKYVVEEEDEEEIPAPAPKVKKHVVEDEDEDEDEDTPPPKVKKEKVKEPTKGKSDLDSILSKFSNTKKGVDDEDDEEE